MEITEKSCEISRQPNSGTAAIVEVAVAEMIYVFCTIISVNKVD